MRRRVGHRSAGDDLAQVAGDEGVAGADRVDDGDRQGRRPVHLVAGQRQRAERTELDHDGGRAALGQLAGQQLALLERRRRRASRPSTSAASSGPAKTRSAAAASRASTGAAASSRPQRGPVVDVERHRACRPPAPPRSPARPRPAAPAPSAAVMPVRCSTSAAAISSATASTSAGDSRDAALPAAVVAHPPRPPAAVLLDHQPGRRVRVADGDHPHALGADLPGDEGAQRVVADPADPGAVHAEPGQPDRDVRLRPADADRQREPPRRPEAGASSSAIVSPTVTTARHRRASRAAA